MRRLPEQKVYDAFKRALDKSDRGFWIQRIENTVAVGMPDLIVTPKNHLPTMIELKCASRPVKENSKPKGFKLRTAQRAWFLKSRSYIISCGILLRVKSSKDFEWFWIPNHSRLIEDINTVTMKQLEFCKIDITDFISKL